MVSVPATMIGVAMFGRTWVSITYPAPPPLARAARTKSRSRIERVAARTSRAIEVQSNSEMMMTTRQNAAAPEWANSAEKPSFVRSTAPSTISSGSSGSAITPSVKRIRNASARPPK